MDLRPALKTAGTLGLGLLALGAVESGRFLAMGPGEGSNGVGWAPMADPADGGVTSPPFSLNLTAEESQGTMDEEFFFWDNQTLYSKMGLA
jgi:hypothetical protein